jgi:hypothetical protein
LADPVLLVATGSASAWRVAYLGAADNVSRLLAIRLRGVNQPIFPTFRGTKRTWGIFCEECCTPAHMLRWRTPQDCEPGEVGGGSRLSPSAQPSHLRVGTVWHRSARCRGQGAETDSALNRKAPTRCLCTIIRVRSASPPLSSQHRTTTLQSQARGLMQELKKVMRGFDHSCRGQGRVFVKLVRQTEHQLLALGAPITMFGL